MGVFGGEEEEGGVRSGPGAARTILVFHIWLCLECPLLARQSSGLSQPGSLRVRMRHHHLGADNGVDVILNHRRRALLVLEVHSESAHWPPSQTGRFTRMLVYHGTETGLERREPRRVRYEFANDLVVPHGALVVGRGGRRPVDVPRYQFERRLWRGLVARARARRRCHSPADNRLAF